MLFSSRAAQRALGFGSVTPPIAHGLQIGLCSTTETMRVDGGSGYSWRCQ